MMTDYFERTLHRISAEQTNERVRELFESLGQNSRNYTDQQKELAFRLIEEKGVHATAKALHIPRRTLQRWCRQHKVRVKRCPEWVKPWAERRRKRREFWQRRGY